jgi:hypothetical protein
MAEKILGTNLSAMIAPFTTADTFATHDAKYGKGGFRSVKTFEELEAITADRTEIGMAVFVTELDKLFILREPIAEGEVAEWVEFTPGTSVSFDGVNQAIADEQARAEAQEAELALNILNLSQSTEAKDAELAQGIADEKARAEAKEAELAQGIADEKARAEAKEGELATAIETEKTRAEGKEAELAQAIADEANRADLAEKANAQAILDEKARAEAKELEIAGLVDAEATRAGAKEAELAQAIADEANRADLAEKANAQAVADEKARAEAKEAELATAIANEKTAREEAIADIEANLAKEMTSAFHYAGSVEKAEDLANIEAPAVGDVYNCKADGTNYVYAGYKEVDGVQVPAGDQEGAIACWDKLSSILDLSGIEANAKAIADEKARAEAKEAELTQAVADEVARATKAEADMDAELKGLIEAEAKRADEAEKANAKAIADEIARAEAKEAEIEGAVATEKARAEEAEAGLTQAIADEATARDNADKAEKERAEAKEAELAQAIADEKTRAEAKEAELEGAIGANAEAIANEIARAEAKEGELATAIADEAKRADEAEKANAEAIATEKGRAEAKEAELEQAIADVVADFEANAGTAEALVQAEALARETADNALAGNITALANTMASDVKAINDANAEKGEGEELEVAHLGMVMVDGTTVKIDDNGVISVEGADAGKVGYENNNAVDGLDGANVQQALDYLLWVAPTVSMTLSPASTVEVGTSIDTVKIGYTLNKNVASAKVMVDGTANALAGDALKKGTHTAVDYAMATPRYDKAHTATFTVSVDDGSTRAGHTATASKSFAWKLAKFHGASAVQIADFDDDAINALTKTLADNGKLGETKINCAGGKYPTFVIPTAWCNGLSFKVGGLGFSDLNERTVKYTNANGVEVDMTIYQFKNLQNGEPVVIIA